MVKYYKETNQIDPRLIVSDQKLKRKLKYDWSGWVIVWPLKLNFQTDVAYGCSFDRLTWVAFFPHTCLKNLICAKWSIWLSIVRSTLLIWEISFLLICLHPNLFGWAAFCPPNIASRFFRISYTSLVLFLLHL